MKCWVCKKQIEGKQIALDKHFLTHTKQELITQLVIEHYHRPKEEIE